MSPQPLNSTNPIYHSVHTAITKDKHILDNDVNELIQQNNKPIQFDPDKLLDILIGNTTNTTTNNHNNHIHEEIHCSDSDTDSDSDELDDDNDTDNLSFEQHLNKLHEMMIKYTAEPNTQSDVINQLQQTNNIT